AGALASTVFALSFACLIALLVFCVWLFSSVAVSSSSLSERIRISGQITSLELMQVVLRMASYFLIWTRWLANILRIPPE
ncbi:hypothetical protein GQ43DRAFT_492728, partial [Delitschia confertaspora ATCC 74209]